MDHKKRGVPESGCACAYCTELRKAQVACFLGYGPPVCTCGRTDGKHGLLCGLAYTEASHA